MNSFILSSIKETKKVLLYKEQENYEFTPRKSYYEVKKITVLDGELLNDILKTKIIKKYNHLLKIIYALVTDDDASSSDVLIAHREIDRIKQYLLSLDLNLNKEFIKEYIKKLYILELELKKVHVIELTQEINEERGKGR